MTIRAVVLDVYGTLLAVKPVGSDAEERWVELCERRLGHGPRLTWRQFCRAVESEIRSEHALAHHAGIEYPEVCWRDVVRTILPEIGKLESRLEEAFLEEQAGVWHRVTLMPGSREALRRFRKAGVLCGIASNAQPYTLHELDRVLRPEGLSLGFFEADLRFWSFEHGFSKPDPHVFRILGARLGLRGIRPEEILMVGDRLDHDIEPAQAQGWRTWHAVAKPAQAQGGTWPAFVRWWNDGEPRQAVRRRSTRRQTGRGRGRVA